MDFSLTEDQSLLKATVDRILAEHYTFEQRQGYRRRPDGFSREIWQLLAQTGLLGLPFPSRFNGFDGGPVESMIVMESFGRALLVEPFLSTVFQCG